MRIFRTAITLAISIMLGAGTTYANGGENTHTSSTLSVNAAAEIAAPVSHRGMIFGTVTGKARSVANIFSVSLYAADTSPRLISSQALHHDGQFTFEALPDGSYWMFVESMGPTIVEAVPSAIKIVVIDGQARQQDVELR